MRSRLFGAFEVYGTFVSNDEIPNASTQASAAVYEIAGVGPEDIDVVQLQDTEAGAEIMHMAENGFCSDGEQEQMLLEGQTRIDGRLPVNTDGGCLANGEPIGASGLRQIHEIVLQLRGQAGKRQVSGDPRLGYTHVYGAPGISAVTILER
jgi:acetyl-CoA acetyltransferase